MDFQNIKRQLNPLLVYQRYVHLKPDGPYRLRGHSPFECKHSNRRGGFLVYCQTGDFYDHCTGRHGDIFDFIRILRGCSLKAAIETAQETCIGAPPLPTVERPKRIVDYVGIQGPLELFCYKELLRSKYDRGHVYQYDKLIDYYGKPNIGERYESVYLHHLGLIDHIKKHGSISGYDHAVSFDNLIIDVDYAGDIEKAKVISFRIAKHLQSTNAHVKAFFTGGKGFHIEFSHSDLNEIKGRRGTAALCKKYVQQIIDKTLPEGNTYSHNGKQKQIVDLSLYQVVHVVRSINSRHSSGLYKIPIRIDELEKLSALQICKIAEKQRRIGG